MEEREREGEEGEDIEEERKNWRGTVGGGGVDLQARVVSRSETLNGGSLVVSGLSGPQRRGDVS